MAFPGTYNFSYYRGDTFRFNIFPKLAQADFDLTNYTADFTIADTRGTGATQYTASATVDSTGEDKVVCEITPTVGRNIAPGTNWVYDVQITNSSSGAIFTILTGNITATDDVTGAS